MGAESAISGRGPAGGRGGREWLVGTRGSPLAMAQAREFARRLCGERRRDRVTLRVFETSGDRMLEAPLATGGTVAKGWFTRELEDALKAGAIDFAVHSLKDLPTTLPDGLVLAGVLEREDVRDVLLYRDEGWVKARGGPEEWSPGQRLMRGFPAGLRPAGLPQDAWVGTSSPRRAAWLRHWVPSVEVVPLRGNVGTRLARLSGQSGMDAAILAMAGLARLGLFAGPGGRLLVDPRRGRECAAKPPKGLMATVLEPGEMLPAPGQGALGIEVAVENAEAVALAQSLNHRNTWLAVSAERAFLRSLGGGCTAPVSAHGRVLGHQLELQVAVGSPAGLWRRTGRRVSGEAVVLGQMLAEEARREMGGSL